MANTVDKVLAIAAAEVGYCEKSKTAWSKYGKECLYSKTEYAGSDNYTKYGYEMHSIYPSVMDFPAYWCDCFVDWCFYKAYGAANAKGLLCGDFDDYTKGSISLYKNKKAFFLRGEKTPKAGDQVFFSSNDTLAGVHHTGLVYEVTSTHIITIEGNTSNKAVVVANGGCVAKKQYKLTDTAIYGYGRPKYDEALKFGWIHSDGKWYYRTADGNYHGWHEITNADGKQRWYYFNPKTGEMLTGWQIIDDKKYYLEESGDLKGAMYCSDSSGAQQIMVIGDTKGTT